MSKPPSHRAAAPLAALISFVATACLVWTLGATPNLDRVLDAQRALVAEQPTSATAYNDLGNLLVVAERFDEAEASYRRAMELDPNDAVVRFNLGLLLQQSERNGEAAETYEGLLELHPRHAWAHYQLGMLAAEANRRGRAVEHYARAFALDPSLSFADVNPHVIDNEMATEALLMSSRFVAPSTARVPRQYAEAERIAELMLDVETVETEAVADDGEVEGEVEVVAGEPESDPESPSRGTMGSGARFDDDDVGTMGGEVVDPVREVQPERSDEERGGGGTLVAGGARVITNDDLDTESEVGQVIGGGQQPRRPRSVLERTPLPQPRSRRDVRGGQSTERRTIGGTPVQGGTVQGAPAPASPRYRPSRRSTASLTLELLPVEPSTPRVAAVGYGR